MFIWNALFRVIYGPMLSYVIPTSPNTSWLMRNVPNRHEDLGEGEVHPHSSPWIPDSLP